MQNRPKLFQNWTRIIDTETAGGALMLLATLLALSIANSAWSRDYFYELTRPVFFGFENDLLQFTLKDFVQDGLMVFFFLFVGLELKYEMAEGTLSQKSQRMLPCLAACGGVLMPALIYIGLTHNLPELHLGWAVPTATDIAFALCIMNLAGKAVPTSAKVFLMALAIIDDLFGILVLVFAYSHTPEIAPLIWASFGIVALALMNRYQVQSLMMYFIAGVYLWFCFHAAGVHTTLAGVIVGAFVPLRSANGGKPLKRFVHFLHPFVAFLILPIFAFANAGVALTDVQLDQILTPLTIAVTVALLLGKPLGIFSAVMIATRFGKAKMPDDLKMKHMGGIAILAGIGFTLSFYLSALAFHGNEALEAQARIGVLIGSVSAGLIGFIYHKIWIARS